MDIDYKELQNLQKQIAEASSVAIPIACQQTLNNVARIAWRDGRKNTDTMFQNRNTWTKRTQTYQQTKELDIDKMVSVAGSSAGYLAQQETGFTRTASGPAGVWVPTPDAADQTGIRTKPVKYRFRRGKIRLPRKSIKGSGGRKRAKSSAQMRFYNIYNAVAGNGFFWGKLGDNMGMWKMDGEIVKGKIILTSVRLLYSANKRSITTGEHKWHTPAVEMAIGAEGEEYFKALKRQWSRLKKKNRIK